MNWNYWKSRKRTNAQLLAKLTEEVGEVASAFGDLLRGEEHNLDEELEHVIFIAKAWQKRRKDEGRR